MKGFIDIKDLKEERILVESAEEFDQSIFFYGYQQVQILLDHIIEENIRRREKRYGCSVGGWEDEFQLHNMISFEGRRGTGKTSMMMSVRKALQSGEENGLLSKENQRQCEFVVLDYIDASMLEGEEELFPYILANMFTKLREYTKEENWQRDYDRQSIFALFDEVYGNYLDIKILTKQEGSISPIEQLTKLSNSQILKQNVRRLVERYLQYMRSKQGRDEGKRCWKYNFLVITIDDLDMHIQGKTGSPYEMLEMLHRYFMIPGVIILLTYHHSELHMGCEKYFRQIDSSRVDMKKTRSFITKMTTEYLNKVLPIYSRVHMLSMRKRDYEEWGELRIKISREDVKDLLGCYTDLLWEGIEKSEICLTQKRFVFLLIAAVAGVYYDVQGRKKHFCEPRTLRQLVQIYSFYRNMNDIKLKSEKDDSLKLEMIYKEILDDVYFRASAEMLMDKESTQFRSYLELPLSRRNEEILRDIQNLYRTQQMQDISVGMHSRKKMPLNGYGDLTYALYLAGRSEIFSKGLICCILNSETIMLTLYRRKMTLAENKEDKCPYRDKLLKIIGDSAVGRWSNFCLPPVVVQDTSQIAKNAQDYEVLKEDNSLLEVGMIKIKGVQKKLWKFSLVSEVDEHKLAAQLQMIEIFGMFYENVSTRMDEKSTMDGFEVEFKTGSSSLSMMVDMDGEKQRSFYELEFYFTDACFDIFGFVTNLLRGEDYYRQLHKNLFKAYEKYWEQLFDGASEEEKKRFGSAESFLKKHSLQKRFQRWYQETDGFALPIESFDMMYNIFKRCYQKLELMPLYVHDILPYIMRVYKEVGQNLQAEDEFYFSNADGTLLPSDKGFYKPYVECPFISYMDVEALKMNSGEREIEGKEFDFKVQFMNMLDRLLPLVQASQEKSDYD